MMAAFKKHTKGKNLPLGRPGSLEKQLPKESVVVAENSMKVLKGFETFEEDLPGGLWIEK